ncbi:hypothetical protein [Actinocatenispora comari]|uniref:Glycoside hydrolase family 42 N-terminal domain-containing protein n=1 Tax=Actinocatenispora comari TaxID=2807577 RepID=A0A8J4AAK2_9ACTN|nr:hypothetical protein [Actinocatenispora comari]GIL28046.1 hypothetical protein NUM_33000 [Actinocatenispora comari]
MTSPRAGLRRRAVLAGGVAAAGLAATARSEVAHAAPPPAVPAGGPAVSPADLPLTGGSQFPIGVFWPPPPTFTTPERYAEIADAGFTFLLNGNYLWDATGITYALRLAEQAGLKMLVTGDPLEVVTAGNFWIAGDPSGNRPQLSVDDATVVLRAVLNTYRKYPAFAGLDLVDDPAANRFTTLAALVGIVRRLAPTVLPYINFRRLGQPWGAWGTPGMDAATYTTYVQQAVDTIGPSVLSYDRYPLNANGTDDPLYFQNWAIVREAGLRANLPTWIYLQSVQYAGHRLPTAAELAWQANVSLAYGAKGVQYFTYWTPDPSRGSGFVPAQALITVAGQRTDLYDAAKAFNTGWLQPAGSQLKPLVSESVVHANDTPLPAGATAFTPDDLLRRASGDAVVLGRFRPTDPADRTRWLLVANRSPRAAATARLDLHAERVARVGAFDPGTGSYVPQPNPAIVNVTLRPGAAALYRLDPR